MKTRMVLSPGLSALVMGGSMVGCTANGGGIASASERSGALADKAAARNADRAQAALERRNGAAAVGFSEDAVGLAPRSAAYRQLLAQSYLQAGRFTSASQAYAELLQVSPGNGRAALNLALAQIATGDWQAGRATLAAHAEVIPAADRGLALALAGDAGGAIALLTDLARSPHSNAKIRQNLALSFALAGDWQSARVVAASDLAPAAVDARLEQWALFAQPATASDQVASLLGVRAVADTGRPVALALASAPVRALASADPTIVDPPATLAAAAPVTAVTAVPGFTRIAFAPRREVVQTLPPRMLVAPSSATKIALASASVRATSPFAKPAAGNWYVQLGAYDNVGVARDAWGRASRRFAMFAGHTPHGTTIKAKGEDFYRLSVGGFARAEADAVCRRYRAQGGACFVRAGAGDRMAQWVRPGVQLASR